MHSARNLPPDGHVCWAYSGRGEFFERAGEFLAEAAANGVLIQYVGAGSGRELRADLPEILDEIPADAAVYTLDEFYAVGHRGVVLPEASVEARAACARAHGRPTRTVVDPSALVRTPEQREAFARFEFLVDGRMQRAGSAALCAFDAEVLAPAEVAELACLHPYAGAGSSLFRIFAQPGAAFALAGEVDRSCRSLFARALERIVPLCPEGPLVVDGRRLQYIDHHGLHTLGSAARRRGATVTLWTDAQSATPDVLRLLGLDDLIVSQAA